MNHSPLLQDVVRRLEQPIQDMLDNGVFLQPDDFWDHDQIGITAIQIRKVARKVAKEQKRPFVMAWKRYDRKWDHGLKTYMPPVFAYGVLTIPKRKYTVPIAAPLELAAVPYTSGPVGAAVMQEHEKSYWNFYIRDESYFEQYIETIRTRPELRAALKLHALPDLFTEKSIET